MNRTEPLQWPRAWLRPGPLDRLLKHVPLWGLAARTRCELRRQMAARPIESLDVWAPDGRLPYCFVYVSSVIQSYMFWRDIRFVPDDPCEILFWYRGIRGFTRRSLETIRNHFALGPGSLGDIRETSYGELVQAVTAASAAQRRQGPVAPLRWPDEWVEGWEGLSRRRKFFLSSPSSALVRRTQARLKSEVRARSLEALRLWPADRQTQYVFAYISSVIYEYMNWWEDVMFIPMDPCEILFLDPTIDLLAETAVGVIEHHFSLPSTVLADISRITYGQLIGRMVEHIT